jgi:hypothetical protein
MSTYGGFVGYLMALFRHKSAWEVEDTLNHISRHRKYMNAECVTVTEEEKMKEI